jgi:lipid II:glycine glycyltransferase (peptidoglycan interpeptide bridge formation enzyme)
MTCRVLEDDFDPKKVNVVATYPMQSWEWGEARKKMGIDVVRLGEFDGNRLQNIFQVTFHKIPRSPFTVGYLPRSVFPSVAVIEQLKAEAKNRRAILVKLEPNVSRDTFDKKIKNSAVMKHLRPAQHSLFPIWTQKMDLTQSEDQMLAHMKSKTRYNIRLAQKKGVVVKEMTNDEGFEIFSQLYFETTARQKYHGHTKNYHKIVFDTLKDSMSHIFIAFYENTPLSAYHTFVFNNVLYYPYGGSSELHKNLMASNLLMWEVIKFGKQQKCKEFDMWGSLPPDYDASTAWGGFTRFKEGFGAYFYEFCGSFDLVENSFIYSAFNTAQSFRKKFLL